MKAQAYAAQTTVDYLTTLGLDADTGNVITSDFYFQTTNVTDGSTVTTSVTVPVLCMIPVPFIRVSDPPPPALSFVYTR